MNLELITGGVWSVAPVAEEPEVRLRHWSIREIFPERTRHFVGWSQAGREGRVSSAIVTFDPSTRRGVTERGRIYELIGPPGTHPDAEYVWGRWMQLGEVLEGFADVTAEAIAT